VHITVVVTLHIARPL